MTVPQGTAGAPTTARRKLRVVNDEPEVIDIHALNRADIPGEDHWRSVWERQGSPVDLPDRPRRVWR
jgi:hypothetical protein